MSDQATDAGQNARTFAFVDDLGYQVNFTHKPERVVSLFGSYSELWLLAGGALSGVTEDTTSGRALAVDEDIPIIGSVHQPNTELIIDLSPDLILMSADLSAHRDLRDILTQAGLACAYMKIDNIEDYLRAFGVFTRLTGREDLYDAYGASVKTHVEQILARVPADAKKPSALLIRGMSSKAKALKGDHMVGKMLADLGADNIASRHESLLEDLSMEVILDEDPDFILVVITGDADKAADALNNGVMANPAWRSLSAARYDRVYMLPKDLFSFKPNERWGESYEYLYNILYP